MQGKGAGPVNRVELESQVLCAALRQSFHLRDKIGSFTSVRELSHLFPDLLPPPEKDDDEVASNKANYYAVLSIKPQSAANVVIAAYLRAVRKFLKQKSVKENRVEYTRILNAGFVLRKPRLRLSHDLVVTRRWLHDESRRVSTMQQDITFDSGVANAKDLLARVSRVSIEPAEILTTPMPIVSPLTGDRAPAAGAQTNTFGAASGSESAGFAAPSMASLPSSIASPSLPPVIASAKTDASGNKEPANWNVASTPPPLPVGGHLVQPAEPAPSAIAASSDLSRGNIAHGLPVGAQSPDQSPGNIEGSAITTPIEVSNEAKSTSVESVSRALLSPSNDTPVLAVPQNEPSPVSTSYQSDRPVANTAPPVSAASSLANARPDGRISREASFVFDESALHKPQPVANLQVPMIIQLLEAAQIIGPLEVRALLAQMEFAPNVAVEKLILNAGYVNLQELNSVKLGESLLNQGRITLAQFQVAIYDERTSGLRMAESLQVRGWLSVEVRNAIDDWHRKRS